VVSFLTLSQSAQDLNHDGWCATLSNYEIYRRPGPESETEKRYAYDLVCLHKFGDTGFDLWFDGLISYGEVSYFVRALPILKLRIDRFEGRAMNVYVGSTLSDGDAVHDVWLQLQNPAPTYERFHQPFLWIALFASYVVDYLSRSKSVDLNSFRRDFVESLQNKLDHDVEFEQWFRQTKERPDLRVALQAQINFIRRQTTGLPNEKHLQSHPIWEDCMQGNNKAVAAQEETKIHGALVTPLVHSSFQKICFERYLHERSFSKSVREQQRFQNRKLGFAGDAPTHSAIEIPGTTARISKVQAGDVVFFAESSNTRSGGTLSFGLVQHTTLCLSDNVQNVYVLRLSPPTETIIGTAPYPVSNELFLTDHCNCKEKRLCISEVSGIHSVDWAPMTLRTTKDFIVRQTYLTRRKAFVTLQDDHKICSCKKSETPSTTYHWGDTVYVQDENSARWSHVMIEDYNLASEIYRAQVLEPLDKYEDLAKRHGRHRIFLNELVLTPEKVDVRPFQIQRPCHVRHIEESAVTNNRIPFPYNRRGTGDHSFVSMKLLKEARRLEWMKAAPWPLKETPALPILPKKLQGLSIFSGGGGLDRGLEETGAVEIKHVVDIDPAAIHTHRANSEHPNEVKFFCGSVDDYLQGALDGGDKLIAPVADIDFICAGCPCQGMLVTEHTPHITDNNRHVVVAAQQDEQAVANKHLTCNLVLLFR
jgi:DNA (cytosine-5)-methyltransferase 1